MAFDYLYDAAHAWTFQDSVNGMKFKTIRGLEASVIETRVALRKSERFVLDDDFVRLAVEASTQLEKLPSWATLARIPFDNVWIEWNQNVRTQRSVELGLTAEPPDYPATHRVGGLLRSWNDLSVWTFNEFDMEGGEKTEDFTVLGSSIGYLHDPAGVFGLVKDDIDDMLISIMGEDFPWPPRLLGVAPGAAAKTPEDTERHRRYAVHMMRYCGILLSPQFAQISAYARSSNDKALANKVWKVIRANMLGSAGVIRFLIAVLAMINDVPKSVATVAPRTGSYKARFRDIAYMGHSLITLKVPKARPARFAMAKLDKAARELAQTRRAHTVRGHYRRTNYSPRGTHTSFRCDHEPLRVQDGVGTCNKCGHAVRWIPHFVRGDASLGWVEHDYLVKAA
jgi:hypothetical protein